MQVTDIIKRSGKKMFYHQGRQFPTLSSNTANKQKEVISKTNEKTTRHYEHIMTFFPHLFDSTSLLHNYVYPRTIRGCCAHKEVQEKLQQKVKHQSSILKLVMYLDLFLKFKIGQVYWHLNIFATFTYAAATTKGLLKISN